jgi:uncharacterized protein YneF (UPF0154 family)
MTLLLPIKATFWILVGLALYAGLCILVFRIAFKMLKQSLYNNPKLTETAIIQIFVGVAGGVIVAAVVKFTEIKWDSILSQILAFIGFELMLLLFLAFIVYSFVFFFRTKAD